MKPIIGIVCGQMWQGNKQTLYVHKPYSEAIVASGGIPVLLPIAGLEAESLLNIVDGLLFPGGLDFDPAFYEEEPMPQLGSVDLDWDLNDIKICKKALYIDMPILGICRGHQLINIAAGGSLIQDINTLVKSALKHEQGQNYYNPIHQVTVKKDTLIYKIFESKSLQVNSSHHQAVKRVAPGFVISATATDGIVEAIESIQHKFVLGLQWHPEWMYRKYQEMLKPFSALCNAASLFRRDKNA